MPARFRSVNCLVGAGLWALAVCGCSHWPARPDATLDEAERARVARLKEEAPESLRSDSKPQMGQRDAPREPAVVVADAPPPAVSADPSLPSRATGSAAQAARPKKPYRANEIPNAADVGL